MKYSVMKAVGAYLAIRKVVLFIQRPIFYLTFYPLILAAAIIPSPESFIGSAGAQVLQFMQDITLWMMGGYVTEPDVLLVLIIVILPTVISTCWEILERVTGVHYLLKRNGFI